MIPTAPSLGIVVPYEQGIHRMRTVQNHRLFFIQVTEDGYEMNDLSSHLRLRSITDSYLGLLPKDILDMVKKYADEDYRAYLQFRGYYDFYRNASDTRHKSSVRWTRNGLFFY